MMFFDPMYLMFMIPGLILAGWASWSVKSAFRKYSEVRVSTGMSGATVAAEILRRNRIFDVTVEETDGLLSDHYDPRTRTVRLSSSVYRDASVASVAIAAHEVGHALQHANNYAPLTLRSMAVPIARFGSYAPWIILIGGMLLQSLGIVYLGIALFAATVLFQVITLPVEFNASSRAKVQLAELGLVSQRDTAGVSRVLNAAAMTYVAAAVAALLNLLYYLVRFGLIGGRRD